MLDDTTVARLAAELRDAARARTPVRQLSLRHPEMTVDDAYAVQRAWLDLRLAEGRSLIGRKIGLTSTVMQQQLGIDEPDHGALLDDMRFDDGGDVPHARFIFPRIEIELAFVLGAELRAPCTVDDVLDATDHVTPAIEILDSRVQMTDLDTGHTRTIVDTIADNAADAGIVVGGDPVGPREVDLPWVAAVLRQNGTVVESGVAAAVLDHPANGVVWLAERLAPHGVSLDAGLLVLAGSFIRAVPVAAGDSVTADYGPLGTVTCRFV